MINVDRLVGYEATLVACNKNSERVDVKIIGICGNKTLMVMPVKECFDLSDKALKATYQLRVNFENVVYTFKTFIEIVNKQPVTYFHLTLPDANKLLTERKSPRVLLNKAALTLSVNTGKTQVKASMADISLDGACLVARSRLAKVDEVFYIDMLINQGTATITLPCKVRYVRTDIQTEGQDSIVFHHGVAFENLSNEAENFIHSFIHAT